jgi:hypothetical protein
MQRREILPHRFKQDIFDTATMNAAVFCAINDMKHYANSKILSAKTLLICDIL